VTDLPRQATTVLTLLTVPQNNRSELGVIALLQVEERDLLSLPDTNVHEHPAESERRATAVMASANYSV